MTVAEAATERAISADSFGTAFSSIVAFEGAQRMAKLLSSSDLVPKQYQGNIPNSIIALEMAQRLQMNPLMVMQNLYMVHNRPAWSSQFLIACINGCGRFGSLRYELTGEEGKDDRTCIAWATDKATGERLQSPPVSIKIAKAEGWYQKQGSKWQTMPELMLRYRAATFFARTYCPELTMGMRTQEELVDIDAREVDAHVVASATATTAEDAQAPVTKTAAVHEKILSRRKASKEQEQTEAVQVCAPGSASAEVEKAEPAVQEASSGTVSTDAASRRLKWIQDAQSFGGEAISALMGERTAAQIAADSCAFVSFKSKANEILNKG